MIQLVRNNLAMSWFGDTAEENNLVPICFTVKFLLTTPGRIKHNINVPTQRIDVNLTTMTPCGTIWIKWERGVLPSPMVSERALVPNEQRVPRNASLERPLDGHALCGVCLHASTNRCVSRVIEAQDVLKHIMWDRHCHQQHKSLIVNNKSLWQL